MGTAIQYSRKTQYSNVLVLFLDWPPESPDNQYHLNK